MGCSNFLSLFAGMQMGCSNESAHREEDGLLEKMFRIYYKYIMFCIYQILLVLTLPTDLYA
jgi:hypothetical protein